MLYPNLSLKLVGIVVGLLLLAGHLFAYLQPDAVRPWLKRFPRSEKLGIGLLAVDLVWAWLIVFLMDWGEFYWVRTPLLVGLPIMFYLVLRFVDEFLAVRALGMLGLLATAPLLNAAYLQPPVSRLLVVVLAYAWAVLGMIWVGQPHTLRDQIDWVLKSAARWKLAVGAGLAYGALTLLCALVFY